MAQKKESTFFNMVLTLVVITLIAGVALAYVNQLTIEPIKQAQKKKKIEALVEVLPDFDNNPVETKKIVYSEAVNDSLEIFEAYKGDSLVGIAVNSVSPQGYSGDVRVMVGFFPDGTIYSISVLQHKETPGLGTKMEDDTFKSQFNEKNPEYFSLQVKKDGGDVDAITAATISSRAFCQAVEVAYNMCIANCDNISGATSSDYK
ncbi:MAG: RnfABCDGE type electron transport complex subunit G [Bacteroidales bacterium]